jgi:hypothetical protein
MIGGNRFWYESFNFVCRLRYFIKICTVLYMSRPLFGVHTAVHGKCKLAFSTQRRALVSTLPP